jgi:hypothetical protein
MPRLGADAAEDADGERGGAAVLKALVQIDALELKTQPKKDEEAEIEMRRRSGPGLIECL